MLPLPASSGAFLILMIKRAGLPPILLLLLLLALSTPSSTHAHAAAHHDHAHHHEYLHDHACHEPHRHHHEHPEQASAPGSKGWGDAAQAFACTAVISILPTLVILFIPMTTSRATDGVVVLNEKVHKLLLSFAAGGLLGEVFLHSLPHLLERHDHFSHHDAHHDHHAPRTVQLEEGEALRVSLWLLAGFLVFFISEKLVKAVVGDAGHSHGHAHAHSHGNHSHALGKELHSDEEGEAEDDEEEEDEQGSVDARGGRRRSPRIRERHSAHERRGKKAAAAAAGGSNGSRKQPASIGQQAAGGWATLKAGAYLNITLDMLHNLTDGVAIGASFASGHGVGVATTLSILLHEVPHELGVSALSLPSHTYIVSNHHLHFLYPIPLGLCHPGAKWPEPAQRLPDAVRYRHRGLCRHGGGPGVQAARRAGAPFAGADDGRLLVRRDRVGATRAAGGQGLVWAVRKRGGGCAGRDWAYGLGGHGGARPLALGIG